MALGPFAGPIYTIILLVQCLFFLFLEWWIPRDSLHYVHHDWHMESFAEVRSIKQALGTSTHKILDCL